jgi:signal peptidase II
MKAAGFALLLALPVAGFDQLIKGLMSQKLGNALQPESHILLPNVLELRLTHNTGTAFGLFHDVSPLFIAAIGMLMLVLFGVLIWPYLNSRAGIIAAGLVVGGALGNLIDRVRLQYVVDYLYFHLGAAFRWPVFNLADMCVVVGIGLLLLQLFRAERAVPAIPGGKTP